MNHPLNTILYGPPGTGKTYTTFRRCVEICGQPETKLTSESIHARYHELGRKERVEFITFHQSYGYEEFVEGLRPDSEGDGSGFRLAVRDGVLKRISDRARQTHEIDSEGRQFYKVSLGSVHGHDLQGVHGRRVRTVRLDERAGLVRSSLRQFELPLRPGQGSTDLMLRGGGMDMISANKFRCKIKQGDIVVVSEGASKYRAVGEVVGDYRYDPSGSPPRWAHRRPVRWHWKADDTGRPVTDFKQYHFGPYRVYTLSPDRPEVLLQHLEKGSTVATLRSRHRRNQSRQYRQGAGRIDNTT